MVQEEFSVTESDLLMKIASDDREIQALRKAVRVDPLHFIWSSQHELIILHPRLKNFAKNLDIAQLQAFKPRHRLVIQYLHTDGTQ